MRRQPARALLPLLALVAAAACSDDLRQPPPTAPAPRFDVAGSAADVGPSPLLAPEPVGIEAVATGLVSPIQLVAAPGRSRLRFIIDQVGMIRVLTRRGELLDEPLLDLRSKLVPLNPGGDERGLLGLAFHPRFDDNGRFFVFYNAPPRPGAPAGFNNTVTVSEFRVTGNLRRLRRGESVEADPASERVVLQVDHPQANHNGGTVAFGPDGFLYVSIGDGGGRDDENPLGHVDDWYPFNAGGNGQDIAQNLLGNILRLDVDGELPYGIPSDNPFVGRSLSEVWAYGFRNPYRFSFDMGGSHDLLAMDAGQELWEEVSLVRRGGNYGWNVKEGTHCFDAETPTEPPASCPDVDPTTGARLEDPVIEFANSKNLAVPGLAFTVVGGNVYRGRRLPAFRGRYIFGGAFATRGATDGRLFIATPQASGLWPMRELLVDGTRPLGYFVKGFGQDTRGEVYVAASQVAGPTGTTGTVFRLVRPRGRLLVSRASGKCLDVAGDASEPASPLVLAACDGGASQRFTVPDVGATGEIRGDGGALCVDAAGGAGNNEDAIILWGCHGGSNQQWTRLESGELRGINGRCIDVRGSATEDGTPIILWDCHGASNQQFDVRPPTVATR
jgi:glucose/arabinose dehydrogenase